tara:strand:+ start:156 stop:1067 length:912 start_codon:yes stop_codon:yes gene_type:complete
VAKLPLGVDIDNLIEDLINFSWEASEILLYYSRILKESESNNDLIKIKDNKDPVTLADLKVNEVIIKRITNAYKNCEWDILSEESSMSNGNVSKEKKEWLWILDPLDGTKDFIQGTGNYAMHLALNYNQKPYLGVVLIPEKNELWISNGEKVWCETSDGTHKIILEPVRKEIRDMTIVTSKNHRNSNLENLIKKIKFKNVKIMGSIGCKIASLIRGENDIYISLSLPGQSCPKDWDFAAPEAILRSFGGAITNLDNEELSYNKENHEQGGVIIASNDKKTHESKCKQIKEIIQESNLFPIEFN